MLCVCFGRCCFGFIIIYLVDIQKFNNNEYTYLICCNSDADDCRDTYSPKTMKGARIGISHWYGYPVNHGSSIWFTVPDCRQSGGYSTKCYLPRTLWFESLNIHYTIGVDGISVAMIALLQLLFLQVFLHRGKWNILHEEFFISLILLATGVFGFFISIDLFTMFLFYEIAVIPMYLLIGIWGSGPKEYSAMKLTLMLMGRFGITHGWFFWYLF